MNYNWQSIVWIALALVLPVSALVGRRLDWKKGVVMALAWAGVIAVTAAFISAVRG